MLKPADNNTDDLLRLLVESVEDYALFVLDPAGYVATWNPGAERIKGYAPDEIIGRHYSVFFPPEARADRQPERELETARKNGVAYDEGWRLRKDGSRFWASIVLTALRSPDGEIVGFAKVTRDLSERREAEEAVRRREARLAEAQRLAHLGSWEWDADADTVAWSDELYRIFGIEPSDVDAYLAAYLDRIHPDDRARVDAAIRTSLAAGAPFELEQRIVRPSGEIRTLRCLGRPVDGEANGGRRLLGACVDITAIKEAERQAIELAREHAARQEAERAVSRVGLLAEASRTLGASLDYSTTLASVARLAVPGFADWCAVDLVREDGGFESVAVHHHDPDRVAQARALRKQFPPDPAAETGLPQVVRAGQAQLIRHITDEMLLAGARNEEHLAVLRDLRLNSAIIAPLVGRERSLGALTLIFSESGREYDDADLVLAEDLARRAAVAIDNALLVKELREAHQALEEQTIQLEEQTVELETQTEDLQETLQALEDSNHALREEREAAEAARAAAEEANATKSRFLATMSHELRTPLNAIGGYTELLDIGVHGPVNDEQRQALQRIQRNQRHLLALINDLLQMARAEAGQIELRTGPVRLADVFGDLEPLIAPQTAQRQIEFVSAAVDPALFVRADRERLDQILLNLLSNAVKFSESGDRIEVFAERDGDAVAIHVRDSGSGIPADRLEKIFEPFVSLRVAGPGQDEGIGLGLAISRQLARAMGGDITVCSTPGTGSTFTVTVPTA